MIFSPSGYESMLTPFKQDRRKFQARSAKVLSAAALARPTMT
jgi:hypothetical protein